MNTILKTYQTETAHIVRGAYSERCAYNVHGHSYRWEFQIQGPINESGMVIDFGNLKKIKQFIDDFDHSMILWEKQSEEFINFFKYNVKRLIIMKKNPTAENMASLLYLFISDMLKQYGSKYQLTKTIVWQTRTGRATATSCDVDDIITYIQM